MTELHEILRRLAHLPPGEDDYYYTKQELVDRAATLPGGLAAVTQLATSSRRDLVWNVAPALADAAPAVTPATSGLVYDLARVLDDRDHEATVANCLTAILRQLMYELPWPPGKPPRDVMLPLMMRALAGDPRGVACGAALGTLVELYGCGLFSEVFDSSQLSRLRARLAELAAMPEPPYAMRGLADFLADGKPRRS